jgi:hypothetical protein
MSKRNHVWVVEMFAFGKWMCYAGNALDDWARSRKELADWKRSNPTEKFRLAKYVAEGKP